MIGPIYFRFDPYIAVDPIEATERLKELWKAEISQPHCVQGEDVDIADWVPANISTLVQ